MLPALQSKLNTLNSELDLLIQELGKYSQQQLNAKPSPDAWSALQVMHHIMLAEKLSVQYVRKKTLGTKFEKAGISSFTRKILLWFFIYTPIKIKAPKIVNAENFPEVSDFQTVVKDWKAVRSDLANMLDNLRPELLDKLIYRHAFAGRMTISGMFVFMKGHFDRHRKQIRRTLLAVGH